MSEDGALEALEAGEAFVDLSSWRAIGVSGADAVGWLNDLLTPDVSRLGPHRSSRALMLSATGAIRADVTVAFADGSLLLVQDPSQPAAIDALLAPYTLSSDVELLDRTGELCLFAFPGRAAPPELLGTTHASPSCLGAGVDLFGPVADHERILTSLSRAFVPAADADVDAWRAVAGVPRFGVDALPEDLPQEAGLAWAVSFDKGCYLGQEAVARVQNLGHPRRLVVHLAAEGPVLRGDTLLSDGREAGVVTSAARRGTGAMALGRVRWGVRAGPFVTASGTILRLAAGS
jgi:folate-binding protein YgfZ